VVDVHRLLSILTGLEDQLWAMSHGPHAPKVVKDLWEGRSERVHTAYGRLLSLATFPLGDIQRVFEMAELGLINSSDKYGKLVHFQEFKTELENVLSVS